MYHAAGPVKKPQRSSTKHLLDDAASDAGQAKIAAHVAVGELSMVEAETVQDRRLEVVHAGGVLGHG